MDDAEIYEKLTAIFRASLGDDTIVLKPETTSHDIPKWDSFRYVDIILSVEEAMNVRIRAREANKVQNIGEIVALIRAKPAA